MREALGITFTGGCSTNVRDIMDEVAQFLEILGHPVTILNIPETPPPWDGLTEDEMVVIQYRPEAH